MMPQHSSKQLFCVLFVILLSFCLTGCGPSATPAAAVTLTPAATSTSAPTSTPAPTDTPAPTPTPVLPRPGAWNAAAVSLGGLTFEVSPKSRNLQLTTVEFMNFNCQGYQLDGNWIPDKHSGGIESGHFTVTGRMDGEMHLSMSQPASAGSTFYFPDVSIDGKFDETGAKASGTWTIKFSDAECSGSWMGSALEQLAEVKITPTNPPSLGEFSGSVLKDAFNNNNNFWYVGEWNDGLVKSTRSIEGGKYRWTLRALKPVTLTGLAVAEEVVDFKLGVDVKIVESSTNASLGLMFRQIDDANRYYFLISDEGEFAVFLVDQNQWISLIDWTPTSAINPGEENRLKIEAVGDQFAFYINNTWVGGTKDNTHSHGYVGLVTSLDAAGDEGTFEFDDIDLYQAMCDNGTPMGKAFVNLFKSSPGEMTILFNGMQVTVRSGDNLFLVVADINNEFVIGGNSINVTTPSCKQNRIEIK